MKPMLDKDFDKFFKSSFEDLEIAPAADSWNKIAKELDKKGTKKFPIFWMAAASVIVVLGIGVGLYIKPTEVIKLTSNKDRTMANLSKEQPKPSIVLSDDLKTTEKVIASSVKEDHKQDILVHKSIENTVEEENQKNNTNDATIATVNSVLAETKTIKPIRAKLVAEQILEDEKNREIIPNSVIAEHTIAAVNNTEFAQSNLRKIKIPTVGDVVNFVVSKVDKREEKIIKVSKTEESDNEITGINLGLFKFIKAE